MTVSIQPHRGNGADRIDIALFGQILQITRSKLMVVLHLISVGFALGRSRYHRTGSRHRVIVLCTAVATSCCHREPFALPGNVFVGDARTTLLEQRIVSLLPASACTKPRVQGSRSKIVAVIRFACKASHAVFQLAGRNLSAAITSNSLEFGFIERRVIANRRLPTLTNLRLRMTSPCEK